MTRLHDKLEVWLSHIHYVLGTSATGSRYADISWHFSVDEGAIGNATVAIEQALNVVTDALEGVTNDKAP